MAASTRKLPRVLLLVTVVLHVLPGLAPAVAAVPQQAIALDAQTSEIDLRNNNVVFRKVHIAQGPMTVTADQGQATKQANGLDFDNSLWVFRGNVKITMDRGQLTSDDAQINFAKKALAKA